ncbi:MAG: helix-turn-helix domain-containing protein [Pseudonocardiaceae bacterium]
MTEPRIAPAAKRLAARLRDLRRCAGITGVALAERCGWTQSKVSKIETGRTVPQLADVEAWCQVTGAPDEARESLVDLSEQVLTTVAAWRKEVSPGLRRKQERIGRMEDATTLIRVFQPALVPGLLQVAAYTERVFRMGTVAAAEDVPGAVKTRMDRQQILFDRSRRFEFVLGEAAIRWRPGPPELLIGQLDRLASLLDLPNIEIGIIPWAAEATEVQQHGFVVFGDHDVGEETFVVVETVAGELTERDTDKVGLYLAEFDRLRQGALVGADARNLLRSVISELARLQS